jgi:hypothetical protein
MQSRQLLAKQPFPMKKAFILRQLRERFQSNRTISGIAQGGIFSKKTPLEVCGSGIKQLWNRYNDSKRYTTLIGASAHTVYLSDADRANSYSDPGTPTGLLRSPPPPNLRRRLVLQRPNCQQRRLALSSGPLAFVGCIQ